MAKATRVEVGKVVEVEAQPAALPPLDIDVDVYAITVDDWLLFELARSQGLTIAPSTVVDFLNRVVKGGVGSIPVVRLGEVMQVVNRHIEEHVNGAPGKN